MGGGCYDITTVLNLSRGHIYSKGEFSQTPSRGTCSTTPAVVENLLYVPVGETAAATEVPNGSQTGTTEWL